MVGAAMKRREFIALAPALALAKTAYAPKVAAQAYVWTQQFDKEKRTYEEGAPEMLRAFERAGYKHLELMSSILTPTVVKMIRLDVPIVYASGPMHSAALAEKTNAEILTTAETAKRVGARYINTNPHPKPGMQAKTDEELAVQAKYVNELAAELKRRDLRLLVHHHNPEMANHAREWRHLLQHTDAALTIDVDWVYQGGQDALAILREAGKRVESLHLRNASGGVWTETVGEGDYDYTAVADYLRSIGYNGWLVVELAHRPNTKITRSLEENLRLSREFVEKTFGVPAQVVRGSVLPREGLDTCALKGQVDGIAKSLGSQRRLV
jgi:inosose dehydratase